MLVYNYLQNVFWMKLFCYFFNFVNYTDIFINEGGNILHKFYRNLNLNFFINLLEFTKKCIIYWKWFKIIRMIDFYKTLKILKERFIN